jgi:hypothetical protein
MGDSFMADTLMQRDSQIVLPELGSRRIRMRLDNAIARQAKVMAVRFGISSALFCKGRVPLARKHKPDARLKDLPPFRQPI